MEGGEGGSEVLNGEGKKKKEHLISKGGNLRPRVREDEVCENKFRSFGGKKKWRQSDIPAAWQEERHEKGVGPSVRKASKGEKREAKIFYPKVFAQRAKV